jgi:hypothetical protein
MDRRRSYFDASFLIIILIGLAFAAALLIARDLGLSRADPSNRMRFHAIPVAISQIYHGRTHDYTADWQVAMKFHNEHPLVQAIWEAVDPRLLPDGHTYFWTADDRGLSDFVNVGFRLFGPTMPSLFYLWFLILGASIAAALIRFWRDPTALTVIACTVIGIGATLPVLARATGGDFAEHSIHLSESRMFDMLGIVALVHLVLVMVRPGVVSRWLDIGTIVAQAALIAALVHARASVAWLFIAIMATGLMVGWLRWRGSGLVPRSNAALIVLASVVVAWASVPGYQRVMFNEAYQGEIGPRTFWHNALMGLSYNFVLARSLNVGGIDRSAIEAVLHDMKARNDPRLTGQWEADKILNSLGSHNSFDWHTYEEVARDLYLRTLLSHPWQALRLFLWDKPKSVVDTISCRFLLLTCDPSRFVSGDGPERPGARLGPWIWFGFLALVAITGCMARINGIGAGSEGSSRTIVLLLLLAALIGLAPSILIYTGVTQLGGTVVLLLTTLGVSVVWAAEHLQRQWFQSRQAAAEAQ